MSGGDDHRKGLMLTVLGVLILTPDTLLIRLIAIDPWSMMVWRGLLQTIGILAILALIYRSDTWRRCKAIGLSDKQMDQIGQAVAEHTKSAIRNRAETRVLRVDLMNLLRNESLDLKSVNVLLKKRAELDVQLQMEGIDIYTKVLQMLDEKQGAMAKDMIGTPFSAPWNEMSMGCGMMMRGGAPSGG